MRSEAVMDALPSCISTAYGGTLYDSFHWSVSPFFLLSPSNRPQQFSRALVSKHSSANDWLKFQQVSSSNRWYRKLVPGTIQNLCKWKTKKEGVEFTRALTYYAVGMWHKHAFTPNRFGLFRLNRTLMLVPGN